MNYYNFFALLVPVAMSLSACGGGSDTPPESVLNFPVGSVFRTLVTSDRVFNGTYTPPGGISKTLQVTYTAKLADQFQRKQTVTSDGTPEVNDQGVISYTSTGNQIMVTSWDNDLGTFSAPIAGAWEALPAIASVGTSGTLAITRKNDSIGLFQSRSLTWKLSAVNESTADFCLGYDYALDWGGGTRTDCFLIDAWGSIVGYRGILSFNIAHVSANEVYQ